MSIPPASSHGTPLSLGESPCPMGLSGTFDHGPSLPWPRGARARQAWPIGAALLGYESCGFSFFLFFESCGFKERTDSPVPC